MADSQSTTVPPVEYRDIPDWPGYRVGDDGGVWSSRGRWGAVAWHQLKPHPNKKTGYLTVTLHRDGRQYNMAVHQLVLLAFVGEPPAGQECCHDNGNRADARRSNLYYGTRAENLRDKKRHGTQQQGEQVHFATLNAEAVIDIRALVASGWSMSRAAKKYHTTPGNVHAIVHRKTWKHVA